MSYKTTPAVYRGTNVTLGTYQRSGYLVGAALAPGMGTYQSGYLVGAARSARGLGEYNWPDRSVERARETTPFGDYDFSSLNLLSGFGDVPTVDVTVDPTIPAPSTVELTPGGPNVFVVPRPGAAPLPSSSGLAKYALVVGAGAALALLLRRRR